MSDSASHLAREAKGIHQALKELLKTHNPWDKEVEFSRKNLRRHYLRLLLVEPYAKESKDAEMHLWMQTSYQFISHYKQSLATLERTLQSAPRHQPRQGGHGPVEYRKLMQRFRQFLAEEEKFWTQFVVRYQRSFVLHEAQPILVTLNILTPSDDTNFPGIPDSSGGEESTPPPDPTEHENRLAILSKAIVCLGDIARYRELYNEAGGRPKAGHEDSAIPAKRGGRGNRGGIPGFDAIPRARNYDKAIQCYEQARLLVPHEGNPSHQLAILAFYQGDMFNSLFHYYRALCVRQPYDTASENVKKILNKALEQQAKRTKDGPQPTLPESAEVPPRLRVEYFKENVVFLHALWRLGSDKIIMNPVAHADDVAKDFLGLVSERILPIEMVTRVVVLSQGALWKHCMIRDTLPSSNRRSSGLPDSSVTESQILTHIIAIHRVLLEIGATELAVPPEDTVENDLAQRITAPFRRTLPALRVASKWLRANIKYVLHAAQSSVGDQHGSTGKGTRGVLIEGLPLFWAKFAHFYSALSGVFPVARLPPLTTPLDEDIDLNGFLPLRDLLVDGGTLTSAVPGNDTEGLHNGRSPLGREKVHPNEEQLMRIGDLLTDAKLLAEVESCPIHFDGNTISFDHNVSAISTAEIPQPGFQVADQISPYVPKDAIQEANELEDDAITDTGRTDDDPVRDAFRIAVDDLGIVDDDDDDDGEVIVYPRPRTLAPVMRDDSSPVNKAVGATTPARREPKSPVVVPPITAQDLLNNVMGPKRGPVDVSRQPRPPTSTQPQFPFGLGPNAPPSIWSTSLDQGTLSAGLRSDGNVGQTFSSPNLQHMWSPQFESTQPARSLAPQRPLQFQSPPSLSTVTPGHRQTTSLGSPQHVSQQAFQPYYTISGTGTQFTEHRQPQSLWQNSVNTPFIDPAIVSTTTPSQPMAAQYGGVNPYQGFSNGHAQQYIQPGQRRKSPSTSRIGLAADMT
ncbi:hypothetical protein JVU11DRAFT_6066 [Chiua virens]|nr:hypothetical protein JVU11DRAFT_6066 [Chiua virens]